MGFNGAVSVEVRETARPDDCYLADFTLTPKESLRPGGSQVLLKAKSPLVEREDD